MTVRSRGNNNSPLAVISQTSQVQAIVTLQDAGLKSIAPISGDPAKTNE